MFYQNKLWWLILECYISHQSIFFLMKHVLKKFDWIVTYVNNLYDNLIAHVNNWFLLNFTKLPEHNKRHNTEAVLGWSLGKKIYDN